MAQVSYGTITITDTNDINRIYVEYCRSTSNQLSGTTVPNITRAWGETTPEWVDGQYIWQRAVIEQSGTLEKTYGTPVCITGAQGETGGQGPQGPQGGTGAAGRSLTSTTTQYTTAATNATITQNNMSSYTWSSNVPTYNASTPAYWVRITNVYSNPSSTEYIIYKDNGITDAVKTSNDANTIAGAAKTQAETAEGKADQAVSTANAANTTAGNAYSMALGTSQHFWSITEDYATGIPAGSYMTEVLSDTFKSQKTGGNLLTRSDGIWIRDGIKTLASLTGSSFVFYRPTTTTTQGSKGVELTSTALKFYNPSNDTISMMDLTSTELVFKTSAGTEIGKFGSDSSGGLLNLSGRLDIRGGGRIGQDSDNYWEFGDNKSYNSEDSAYLMGKGTASIQLGETGHWRLDSNRIHTGWYQLTDSTKGTIHFDTGAEGNTTYYWDYGLHYPNKSGNGNNKFLYVRRSSNSTSTSLATMKGRIDDDSFWIYKFYVDGNGNVHSPSYYIINSDGTEQTLSGSGLVASSLSCGTIGSSTQPVYFNNGIPATTTYALNAAGAKDVVTDIANNASSTNLPTTAAVVSYVTSRGYITSYTDNKVQTSQANTTKIFLAGTSTSGTSTGTLSYDSNVYLTTTAGTLHATTFEGNLSGTATKANQDGDGNVIKTTYLKLSGGNVTGPVTFGSSISANELTVGDLVVNGAASFTNNLQVNTINGVAVGSSPKFTDNNTTYTFTNGTNGFTVTPSGGEAQTVTVTPSISNNITGTGTRTSGYLVKFSGTNTITNGPAIGTGTTKFLREDGTWVVPGGTYSLPTASSSTLGGIKVGSGLSISDGVLSHTDTSSQISSSNSGRTYIQSITLDTYGHVTGLTTASESVTDTHYTTHLYAGKSDGNANAATTNGNTYLMILDNTTVRDRRKISGSGAASVTSDANGNITINSPVAITGVSFANGTITFTKSDSTTIPITTDNFVITQASGATALVKLKSGSTTEYEGYSAGGATTAPVYFDTDGHPVAVTSIPASLISGSVTPTSHNHSQIVTVGDQRSTATTPNDYVNALIFKGLKIKATIGSPSSDTYSYLIGLRGWSDSSGGRSHEIAFNNTGIFVRQESSSTANTWGSWYQIYTTGNKPTKSDVGLGNVANSDTTNASNITSGTLAKERLATSGATAGSYGDSAAQTPSYGSTFKVPYITVDTYGRVTSISEHTVKIPASDNTNTHRPIQLKGTEILGNNTTALNFAEGTNVTLSNDGGTITINSSYVNTDTKVNMKARGTTKAYVLGTTTSPTSSNQAIESVAETGVYFDTTAGKLVATTFSGSLSGNASTATTASKLGSSNVGAADRPIYLSAGSPNQTTYRMAATNANAISALGIDTNLDTGIWYVNGTNSTNLYSVSDGAAYVNKYSDSWIAQIYQDYRTGQIALRGKNNGTWQAWRKVLDSSNYTNYLGSVYVKTTDNEGVLGTKVFGSGTSYGSVTNNTTYTEKANINYDSTLEAIVFSFA